MYKHAEEVRTDVQREYCERIAGRDVELSCVVESHGGRGGAIEIT